MIDVLLDFLSFLLNIKALALLDWSMPQKFEKQSTSAAPLEETSKLSLGLKQSPAPFADALKEQQDISREISDRLGSPLHAEDMHIHHSVQNELPQSLPPQIGALPGHVDVIHKKNVHGLSVVTDLNPMATISKATVHVDGLSLGSDQDSLKQSLKKLDPVSFIIGEEECDHDDDLRKYTTDEQDVDKGVHMLNIDDHGEKLYDLRDVVDDDDLDDDNEPINLKHEEDMKDYVFGGYHPAFIGEEYNKGRYILVRKLGWGYFSTVWLAKDLIDNKHVAMKIIKSANNYREVAIDEIKILTKINKTDKLHPGHQNIVELLDYFDHEGPNGNHICMVFEVLGENLLNLIRRYRHRGLPIKFVKQIAKQSLLALDCLHRKCGIIHTDIKPENIMIKIDNIESLVAFIEEAEWEKRLLKRISSKIMNSRSSTQLYDTSVLNKSRQLREATPSTTARRSITGPLSRKSSVVGNNFIVGSQPLPSPLRSHSALYLNSSSASPLSPTPRNVKIIPPSAPNTQTHNSFSSSTGSSFPNKMSFKDIQKMVKSMEDDENELFNFKPPMEHEIQDDDLINIKIADLGNACWIFKHFTDDIQTRQYRSPEVILRAKWGASSDIWSLGCLIFELLTGDFLFDPTQSDKFGKNDDHLAQIIELLVPIPKHIVKSGKYGKEFFESDCRTLKRIKDLKPWPLVSVLMDKYKFSEHDAVDIESFLRGMLILDPAQRMDAAGLSNHYWLNDCNNVEGFLDHPVGTRGDDIGEGWYKEA